MHQLVLQRRPLQVSPTSTRRSSAAHVRGWQNYFAHDRGVGDSRSRSFGIELMDDAFSRRRSSARNPLVRGAMLEQTRDVGGADVFARRRAAPTATPTRQFDPNSATRASSRRPRLVLGAQPQGALARRDGSDLPRHRRPRDGDGARVQHRPRRPRRGHARRDALARRRAVQRCARRSRRRRARGSPRRVAALPASSADRVQTRRGRRSAQRVRGGALLRYGARRVVSASAIGRADPLCSPCARRRRAPRSAASTRDGAARARAVCRFARAPCAVARVSVSLCLVKWAVFAGRSSIARRAILLSTFLRCSPRACSTSPINRSTSRSPPAR